MLGIVTEVTVKLLPQAGVRARCSWRFDDVEARAMRWRRSSRAGIIPAGLEMMDQPAIAGGRGFRARRLRLDADAVLLVEPDGTPTRSTTIAERSTAIAARERRDASCGSHERGASACVLGRPQERVPRGRAASAPTTTAWMARSRARSCREVLGAIAADGGRSTACAVANVFHAGDGNLHPLILFDANVPGELERAEGSAPRS